MYSIATCYMFPEKHLGFGQNFGPRRVINRSKIAWQAGFLKKKLAVKIIELTVQPK